MLEHVLIGSLTCDFLSPADFLEQCKTWLVSDEWHHVVTLNAEMVVLAEQDTTFQTAAVAATMRVPEGGPLWAKSYLQSSSQSLWHSLGLYWQQPRERITGVDMVWNLAKLAADNGQSLYLLGGTAAQNIGAAQALKKVYPNLAVITGKNHNFSIDGPLDIIQDIQAKQPVILLIAYGAPKQTIWLEQHKHELPTVRIAVGVGGALAMIAGELPRAPLWLQRHNLEWTWRLWLEPWRIKRIWRAVVVFPRIIQAQKQTQRI